MGYHKCKQLKTLIAVGIPDMASLLEQINIPRCLICRYSGKCFFSIPVPKVHQKNFAFSWQGQKNIHCSISGDIDSPSPWHNLVCRDLDYFSLPQDIILPHYIVLTGPSEQEGAITLHLLVRHLYIRVGNKSN